MSTQEQQIFAKLVWVGVLSELLLKVTQIRTLQYNYKQTKPNNIPCMYVSRLDLGYPEIDSEKFSIFHVLFGHCKFYFFNFMPFHK